MLSSIIFDHLTKELPPTIPVLCVFLEKTPSVAHTTKNLVGSLLKQLIQLKESGISAKISNAYRKATRLDLPTVWEEISELFEVSEVHMPTIHPQKSDSCVELL